MQIPFVGFNVVRSSEVSILLCVLNVHFDKTPKNRIQHLASIGMFGLFQLFAFQRFVRSNVSKRSFKTILRIVFILALIAGAIGIYYARETGLITPWTGRFYRFLRFKQTFFNTIFFLHFWTFFSKNSMFDPTYAKIHIPIIASVSEHQPTTWGSFVHDLHLLVIFAPAAIYFCFYHLRFVCQQKDKLSSDSNPKQHNKKTVMRLCFW